MLYMHYIINDALVYSLIIFLKFGKSFHTAILSKCRRLACSGFLPPGLNHITWYQLHTISKHLDLLTFIRVPKPSIYLEKLFEERNKVVYVKNW